MLTPEGAPPALLLVTPQLPYPPQQGTSLRNFHIVQGLAGATRLTLLSLTESEPIEAGPLAAWCQEIVTLPAPARSRRQRLGTLLLTRQADMARRLMTPELAATLRAVLTRQRFDLVQIEGIELAPLMAEVRASSPASRLVFDNHNAETALQARALATDIRQPARWPAAAYSWVQVRRLRRLERWACRTADGVTVVSAADQTALEALAPDLRGRFTVVPNCIDVQRMSPEATGPRYDVVFTGKMDFRPNVDAVAWFAEAIWPLIRQARPQTTWAIVGQKPHARLAALNTWPGVTVTGWVPDTAPYLSGAQVVILPLRMGSGTRLKLIEAMATGRAVVSTQLGAEGYPVRQGQELYLADDPPAFAAAVLQLLENAAERERLGQAARRFAAAYDWRVVTPTFMALYARLLAATPSRPA